MGAAVLVVGWMLSLTAMAAVVPGVAGCERPSQRAAASLSSVSDTSEVYSRTTPSRNGTGKVYMGREIAEVMGHRGAGWLERPERVSTELPARVVEAMNLQPSDVAADVGAGTGYFTFRLANKVPRGTVYAVDIQPEMLARIRRKMKERGVSNVEPIHGTIQNPRLPEGRVDAVLLVDAYHEFSYPHEMMLAIKKALRPGGRVYLVEYRKEDPTIPIKPLHKMTEKQAIREMSAVGLRHRSTKEVLPRQHLMIFGKPAR